MYPPLSRIALRASNRRDFSSARSALVNNRFFHIFLGTPDLIFSKIPPLGLRQKPQAPPKAGADLRYRNEGTDGENLARAQRLVPNEATDRNLRLVV